MSGLGSVVERLADLAGGDLFQEVASHDDAWFAKTPDHLEPMIRLLRPGGVLTMANWFLLVDAMTGQPRNDWSAFAGDGWAQDTLEYAQLLAARRDLRVNWIITPPLGIAVKLRNHCH
jgi:hypothetical protein